VVRHTSAQDAIPLVPGVSVVDGVFVPPHSLFFLVQGVVVLAVLQHDTCELVAVASSRSKLTIAVFPLAANDITIPRAFAPVSAGPPLAFRDSQFLLKLELLVLSSFAL
jgi:hypothetical protein